MKTTGRVPPSTRWCFFRFGLPVVVRHGRRQVRGTEVVAAWPVLHLRPAARSQILSQLLSEGRPGTSGNDSAGKRRWLGRKGGCWARHAVTPRRLSNARGRRRLRGVGFVGLAVDGRAGNKRQGAAAVQEGEAMVSEGDQDQEPSSVQARPQPAQEAGWHQLFQARLAA